MKTQGELPVAGRCQLVFGQLKVAVEPLKEGGFEDALAAVEGIAREPDEFGLVKAEGAGVVELLAKLAGIDEIGETDLGGAIDEGKRGAGRREVLPDELEHEQLVEVGIQQGAGDRVELPVVIVRAAREVNDHNGITLLHAVGGLRRCRV